MATANETSLVVDEPGSPLSRRPTAHLKTVPENRDVRQYLQDACREAIDEVGRDTALTKRQLEQTARLVLERQQLGEEHLGWTMVCLVNEFWRDQVAAVPISRRLLLLPAGLRHLPNCHSPLADTRRDCAACTMAEITRWARELGYRILPAEGAVRISRMVIEDQIDAVLGVADLNVLEKAFDKVISAGIPSMAIPVLTHEASATLIDEDWIRQMIEASATDTIPQTHTYIHLMRLVRQLFEPDQIEELVPRSRGTLRLSGTANSSIRRLDPLAATEAVAYDFLIKGGKYSRPFITLAVYDALTGGKATLANGTRSFQQISNAAKRAAIAIETFHKASLVHDDIEDDDEFRYGQPTLHRSLGIPAAINVGDYLIGMGYRMVARDQAELGPRATANILAAFAEAHRELSEGQGAELFWRDAADKHITPTDALMIYRLKTSPAFEAALIAGASLAERQGPYRELFREFAHSLGVGFQVLNDLKDWNRDEDNKLTVGADVLGGRPTLLLALALQTLGNKDQAELMRAINDHSQSSKRRLSLVRELFAKAQVFARAQQVVDQQRQLAEQLAARTQPVELQRLLYYLIEIVLDGSV